MYTSLLMLGVASLLLPTLFYKAINSTVTGGVNLSTDPKVGHHVLLIGYGVGVIQLFVYFCFQFFRRFSHRNIWGDNDPSMQESVEHTPQIRRMLRIMLRKRAVAATDSGSIPNPRPPSIGEPDNDRVPQVLPGSGASSEDLEGDEKPQMCLSVALMMLVFTSSGIFFIGGSLVSSVDDIAFGISVSREFVSIIILSLLGNVQEIKSAVKASLKDKLTEALAVTVGSSIETALLIFPLTATVGWILGKPLPLLFDTFEATVLFFSVLIVNYVVRDGRSNWLEGMFLICIYIIFAVTSWYYPISNPNPSVFVPCVDDTVYHILRIV